MELATHNGCVCRLEILPDLRLLLEAEVAGVIRRPVAQLRQLHPFPENKNESGQSDSGLSYL